VAEFKPKVWMTCPLCGKQSPMPDPDAREWVDLTDREMMNVIDIDDSPMTMGRKIEAKLKEKNEM
jgi:hypothetical protein